MKTQKVYLVAKYFAKPRKPHATLVPGYMKEEGNVKWDEQIEIVSRVKPKDLSTAKIILNIVDQKVEKNGFQTGKTFDELFNYFYTSSKQEITEKLLQFGISVGKNDGDEHVSETVQAEAQTGEGSELTTAGEPA